MSDDIRINGLAELQGFLNQLSTKLERNVMRGALRKGAAVMRDEARQNISGHKKSGKLAKGIQSSSNAKRDTVYAYVKTKGQHGYIGRFLEYGVRPHSLKKGAKKKSGKYQGEGRTHPGISPKPFMRPAFDSKKEDAVIAVGNEIKRRLAILDIHTPDIMIGGDDGGD